MTHSVRVYEIIICPALHLSPMFRFRDDKEEIKGIEEESEWDRGRAYIDKMFDFTGSFNDLGYWDSNEMLNYHVCDEALIQLRSTLLRMQSEQISPRVMSHEEAAYYRFPSWWFGTDDSYSDVLLDKKERKSILMRHLIDMYNEIRLRPEFRAEADVPLFYCKYA